MLVFTAFNFFVIKDSVFAADTKLYELNTDANLADFVSSGGNSALQKSGNPTISIVNGATSLLLADRSNSWDALDLKRDSLKSQGVFIDGTYTITVTGHLANIADASTSRMVLGGSSTYAEFVRVTPNSDGSFILSYTHQYTASDLESLSDNFRIQDSGSPTSSSFYIDGINVTVETSTDTITLYGLDTDTDLASLAAGGGNAALQRSGSPTISIVETKPSLLLTGRSASYDAVDIKKDILVNNGAGTYKITVTGHLANVADASTSRMVLGGSSTYTEFERVTPNSDGSFVLTYTRTYTESDLASFPDNFRIQDSGSPTSSSFYIDNIVVAVIQETEPVILPSLKDVYKDYFLLGNVFSARDLEGPRYDLLKDQFDALTAENAMKPSELLNDTNYTKIDSMVSQIMSDGFTLHGHTLVWPGSNQMPSSLYQGMTRSQVEESIRNYISDVVGHFAGQAYSWDVVNEAISDNADITKSWQSSLKASGLITAFENGATAGQSGADFIEFAFKQARAADPNAILYYNDYNLDNPAKARVVYEMVKEINDKYLAEGNTRLLIEGIGEQAHYGLNTIPANVENSIKLFSTLGVKVSISELDVVTGSVTNISKADEQRQAILYAKLFQVFKNNADVIERVTFWGIDDVSSWKAPNCPLLFNSDLSPKEAFYAVLDPDAYLANVQEQDQIVFPKAQAFYGSPVLGTNDTLWDTARAFNVNTAPPKNSLGDGSVATAQAQAMWDEEYIYVRVLVKDSNLTQNSDQFHEKDSVEVFVSETANRGAAYSGNDNQYRVAYDGTKSIKIGSSDAFESSAQLTSDGYLVELKIPFKDITPSVGTDINFDVQINDVDGTTRKLTVWSDETANGYNTPQYWGTLTLIDNIPNVPGIIVNKEGGLSFVNIILGNDPNEWPWSSATDQAVAGGEVAFTPEKDATYRLTFNVTSTGAQGYRVRWVKDNTNTNYADIDSFVTLPENTYAYGAEPKSIPASFTSGIEVGTPQTFVIEFTMDGSAQAGDMNVIGNIGIRGLYGSSAFDINWIQIETLDSKVIARWPEGITPEPPAPTPTTSTPIFASNNVPATTINDPYVYLNGSSSNTTSVPATPATGCGLRNAVINAKNVTIKAGDKFNIMQGVTARDDGGKGADLTSKVTARGVINTHKVGKYSITYSVKGCNGNKVSRTITVTVK